MGMMATFCILRKHNRGWCSNDGFGSERVGRQSKPLGFKRSSHTQERRRVSPLIVSARIQKGTCLAQPDEVEVGESGGNRNRWASIDRRTGKFCWETPVLRLADIRANKIK
jgi:hypothetical protein